MSSKSKNTTTTEEDIEDLQRRVIELEQVVRFLVKKLEQVERRNPERVVTEVQGTPLGKQLREIQAPIIPPARY